MRSLPCLICALFAILLFCGCTELRGSTGSVVLDSIPPGAEVYIDGNFHGITPVTVAEISPGIHHVTMKGEGSDTYETDIDVSRGSTARVEWQRTPTPTISSPPLMKVFSVSNLVGYRGGGDYITGLVFDLSLAPGAKPVNISEVSVSLAHGDTVIQPFWQVTDKMHANTDDLLEYAETFRLSTRTPNMKPGEKFTLTVTPPDGEPYSTTQVVPSVIGWDTKFPA